MGGPSAVSSCRGCTEPASRQEEQGLGWAGLGWQAAHSLRSPGCAAPPTSCPCCLPRGCTCVRGTEEPGHAGLGRQAAAHPFWPPQVTKVRACTDWPGSIRVSTLDPECGPVEVSALTQSCDGSVAALPGVSCPAGWEAAGAGARGSWGSRPRSSPRSPVMLGRPGFVCSLSRGREQEGVRKDPRSRRPLACRQRSLFCFSFAGGRAD